MNRKRPISCVVGLSMLVVCVGCVRAPVAHWKDFDPQTMAHPMTLAECLKIAHSVDLNEALWRARIEAARAALRSTREIPNPNLALTWDDVGVHDDSGASISSLTYGLGFPIFFWWTRGAETAEARANIRSEEAGVRGEECKLALAIGTAWYGLAAAQRKIAVREKLKAEADDALTLARESLRLGTISAHDLRRAEAEALQNAADLESARSDARAQGIAFSYAMGADRPIAVRAADEDGVAPWALPMPSGDGTTAPSLPDVLAKLALARDPDLSKARADTAAATARFEIESRKALPLGDISPSAGPKHDPGAWGWAFGLGIPIPIFNWNRGGIEKARDELVAAQANEALLEGNATGKVAMDWDAWRAAQDFERRYSQPLDDARSKLADETRELFRNGQASYTDMIQARRDHDEAALAAIDNWLVMMTARWKVRCDVGETGLPSITAMMESTSREPPAK